jgi:solute:Na+ symporter, SSS family
MTLQFTPYDWAIVAAYILLLAVAGLMSSRRKLEGAADYFLAGKQASVWMVAISVLSTTQSAATFLGAPDYSFRGDYTYLASYLGAVVAAIVVANILIPKFYALRVNTVYELLDHRFGGQARAATAAMYLVGRVFASGARLYLAAIAISMIIFYDVAAGHIVMSSFILLALGLAFTFFGGLRSIIWSDLLQVVIYVGAALVVLIFIWTKIPADAGTIVQALAHPPAGDSKLQLLDFSGDFARPFTLLAIFTGFTLLNIGNFGLDQDTTQRLLACRDARDGKRALIASVLASIPVVLIFMIIGSLLYIFYERSDIMGRGADVARTFQGEKITMFMHFILSEVPPGLRGFLAVGVIAAAAINSGLISMASVLVQDFYRPWCDARTRRAESHFVQVGRVATIGLGLVLFAMSILCYYWQHYTSMPLLEFVLGVMTFAYSGLLGVFMAALFTRRGSSASVVAALITGFVAILVQQDYIVDIVGLPASWKSLAFPWQLTIGTLAAFLVCISLPSAKSLSPLASA